VCAEASNRDELAKAKGSDLVLAKKGGALGAPLK